MRDRGFLQRPFCKPGLEMQLDMKSCHRKYKEVKNGRVLERHLKSWLVSVHNNDAIVCKLLLLKFHSFEQDFVLLQ